MLFEHVSNGDGTGGRIFVYDIAFIIRICKGYYTIIFSLTVLKHGSKEKIDRTVEQYFAANISM